MSMIKTYNPETGKWEVRGTSLASSLGVTDFSGNFTSNNVEGCLRELAEKANEQGASVKAATESAAVNKALIDNLIGEFEYHLNNHPGGSGSGGGGDCKITSTFEGGVVDAEKELIIPVFFSSNNKGSGTLFLSVNGIEIQMLMIEQGNNRITVPVNTIESEIEIYVKDSKGMMSNLLYWNVIKGGIDFKLNFNFDIDYSISDNILIRYEIDTPLEEALTLELTYNGVKKEFPIEKGIGQKVFTGRELGIGIHQATLRVVCGDYKSKTHNVSLVIVSSHELYLSSTFKGGTFEYGSALVIPYRISKMSTEFFEVKRILDGKVKTLSSQAGVHQWTIPSNELPVGEHNIRIEVTGVNGDSAYLEYSFSIVAGEYKPIEVEKTGLLAWYDVDDMSNDDENRDVWIDRSGNNVLAKLHNFNYATNGWIEITDDNGVVKEKVLRCDNDAYVEIDMAPFEDNALYGLTIEILYKSNNIGYEEARILDCTEIVGTNPDGSNIYKGAFIDVLGASLRSDSQIAKVTLDEDTEVRITYVLDRFEKFCKVYIDGVLCRAFYLKDAINGVNKEYENFQHTNKIYLNSEKGIDKSGACDIKTFRIYNMALTSDQVLKNHIADIKDLELQKEKYDFNYNQKVSKTPVITLYGTKDKFNTMSGEQEVPLRIKYDSPNPDFYGESFDLPNCSVKWQGSSSLEYVLKNYTIYLKDENFSDVYYTPFKNGVPENVFCLKADYIESSHANNLGLAKFVHDCLYETPTPAQMLNSNYRTTVDGFPVLLYADYMDGKERVLLGAYNLNLDRYSTASYGYEDERINNKILAYEISANSDITAGAFNEWTPESGKDEKSYYQDSFKLIYPPSRKGTDNYEEIKRVVRWVSSASDEVFKDLMHQYFNIEYLMRYYLFVMVMGAVDSLGKNMKLVCYNANETDQVWYPQLYDMDTVLGLNNTGNLIYDSDIEVEEGIFNTTASVLWTKLRRIFQKELRDEYARMRKDRFTVDNIMKYLYDDQISKIPERNYNLDAQTKYLDFGPDYLNVCHGNRYHHMKRWIRERLVYVDTLLGYTGEVSDTITMRINKAGNVSVWLETYIPMYLTVKWKDLPDEVVNGQVINRGKTTVRVGRNQKVEFKGFVDTATDQNVFIYAGKYLKSIDGLSELRVSELLFGRATRLTKLECHSDRLINTQVSSMENLQYLDLSGCTKYGDDLKVEGGQKLLDLTKCKYLKKVDISDTALTALSFNIVGGSIEEIVYPSTVQNISISNQTKLKKIGIPYGYKSIIRNSEPLSNTKYDYVLSKEEMENNPDAVPNINKPTIKTSTAHLTFKDPVKVIYGNQYKVRMSTVGGEVTIYEFNLNGDLIDKKSLSMVQESLLDYSPTEGTDKVIVVLNSNNVWTLNDMQNFRFALSDDINKYEEATALQIFSLNNCRRVEQFTQYKYPLSTNSLDSIKHVQNLTLANSLSLDEINVKGMSKLRNINLSGLDTVKKISFNDMNTINDSGLLESVTISNCANVDTIEMNISNAEKSITFSQNARMDLSNLSTLKTIKSNTPILGLSKILINPNLSNLIFDNEYNQNWDSSIKDIWSYENEFTNSDEKFTGIDFTGLKIKDLSLEALKGISNVKNFSVSPEQKLNIQGNRDGETYPFLVVDGVIDLTNYKGSCVNLFKNMDLRNITVIRNSDFTQTDFTGMFEGAIIDSSFDINSFMGRIKNATNCTRMFARSNITEAIFPSGFGNNANISEMFSGCKFENLEGFIIPNKVKYMSGLFKDCENLSNIEGLILPENVVDISYLFSGCHNIKNDIDIPFNVSNARYAFKDCTSITHVRSNWNKEYYMGIAATGCYSGCTAITHIDGLYILASDSDNGLSYLPEAWGGGGMSLENTCVFNINTIKNDQDVLDALRPGEQAPEPSLTVTLLSTAKDYSSMMPSFIDWGDGTITSSISSPDDCVHTYAEHGIYTVKFNSLIYSNQSYSNNNVYGSIRDKIIEIRNIPTLVRNYGVYINITTFRGLFSNLHNLRYVNLNGLPNDQYYNAEAMFQGCENEDITIVLNKTLKFSSLANMFNGCKKLTVLDVSNFDISQCTSLYSAFNDCSSLKNIIGLASLETRNVVSLNETFARCKSLLNIKDVEGWNVSNVTDMGNTFTECYELRRLNLSEWNMSNVLNIYGMFYNCTNLSDLDVSNWSLNKLDSMWDAFSRTGIETIDLSSWKNTGNITSMWSAFSSCGNLTSVNMTNMNLSKVSGIDNLFYNCKLLRAVDLSGTILGTRSQTGVQCGSAFSNCSALENITMPSEVKCSDLTYVFNGCTSIENIDLTTFDVSDVTSTSNLFNRCTNLKTINLTGWNTNKLNNTERMFAVCSSLEDDGLIGLEDLNVSSVTNMSSMFRE